MAVAREVTRQRYLHEGTLTLRHWRGGWWAWHGTHWAEAEHATVRAALYTITENAVYLATMKVKDEDGNVVEATVEMPWTPNRRRIADLAEALNAVTHLEEIVAQPCWLTGARMPDGPVVACRNGLLHVPTRTLHRHTPEFFNVVSVPFDYDPGAREPKRWLAFLAELWPGDDDAVAAVQEFFGYVLSGRTDLHKILLLVGPIRSGKGTIARVLTALVGAGNVAGPTLASLGTNFGLSPLLGKPLAVVSDARLSGADTRQVVERLLSISGEDRLTVDRKYREPWSGTLPTRFVILSNELPAFGDASGAIATRFVVLMLIQSWLGRENNNLTAELLPELAGILNWSLEGLDRLSRTGALTEPASSADAVTVLADLVSPVSAFIRDRCEHGGEVPVGELYGRWRMWCEANGHRPSSRQVFGRDLRSVVPGLRMARPRFDGDRERHYVGLSLRGSAPIGQAADRRGPGRTVHNAGRDESWQNRRSARTDRDGPQSGPIEGVPEEPPSLPDDEPWPSNDEPWPPDEIPF
jgi:putative DNA primase/helicase